MKDERDVEMRTGSRGSRRREERGRKGEKQSEKGK